MPKLPSRRLVAIQAARPLCENLEPEIRKFNYAANLLAARQLLDGLPKTEWQSNIYVGWLDGLRQLFPQPDSDQFPRVMRSREWQRKQLQTTLASWAELRHDTILYAKQSYSGSIICEYPEGYVEPYPAFYGALKDLAREAATLLRNNDLDPPDPRLAGIAKFRREQHGKFFDGFANTMDQLQTIAVKELRAQLFEQPCIQTLLPPLHEPLDFHAKLFLQSGARSAFPTPIKLALQLAARVAKAQARSMRRLERTTRRPAKRATGVTGARRFQMGGCRPGKPQRR